MALSNGLLSVDLDIAAVNLLGFEHAPRSVAEREKLATAVAWLKSARNVLGVPTNAGCRLQSSEVATPQFAPGEDHVDVEARWTFRCTNATALYWFEPWLLRRLLAIELLEINIVTDQLQTQEQVRQPTQRVVLR